MRRSKAFPSFAGRAAVGLDAMCPGLDAIGPGLDAVALARQAVRVPPRAGAHTAGG